MLEIAFWLLVAASITDDHHESIVAIVVYDNEADCKKEVEGMTRYPMDRVTLFQKECVPVPDEESLPEVLLNGWKM